MIGGDTKGRGRRLLFSSACCALLASSGAFGQVVPDGGTATTVSTDPLSGAMNVQIAPVANSAGISLNTYTEFSVAPAGVNLDNRAVNARTILNEVTSSRVSNLNGPLEVLGPRAHLIVANPNGVRVDSATFRNTGGVVLTTGKPSIVAREIAPGFTQDNVVLETSGGRVDVGPGGLGGAMTSLQLIAGKIGIDGAVENTSGNLRSDIRLIAGGSSVEYDSAILPISDLENWGKLTEKGVEESGVAVEITSKGSLKANSVRIKATNKGAGVSHAGKGLASLGDFVIDATGKVTTTGSISAFRNVTIRAGSIKASSVTSQPQQTIEAINGALTLLATSGGIENTGVLMSGSVRNLDDPASLGAVTMKAAGDISLLTENADQLAIVFAAKNNLVAVADDDIINNTGRLLSNAATLLFADGNIENVSDIEGGDGTWSHEITYGKRLWYTLWQQRSKVEKISVNYGDPRVPGQQAYIVGSTVVMHAGGDVVNRASTINANAGSVEIEATNVLNEGGVSGSVEFYQSCGLTCVGYGTSDTSVVGGAINAADDINLKAHDSIVNKGGQMVAFGDVSMTAPNVELITVDVPSVITRPPGLYNFWQGSSAWIGTTSEGGLLVAPYGKIEIQSFAPVRATAGALEARDGIIIPAGREIVSLPPTNYPFGKKSIGLYRKLTGE